MKTMRAVQLSRHGRTDVLKISQQPQPLPGPGQVQVRIETIGLNYAEVQSRKGLYGWAPKLPYIPGMEAYGEISAIGEGVLNRHVGEKVIVGAQYGSYAEFIVIPEYAALHAIAGFSPEENAAFAVNFLTAWVSLFRMGHLAPNETVLIQAAAGGVGTAALRLAKAMGSTVFGTAGSDEKVQLLQSLGADYAVNYRTEDFEQAIRSHTNEAGVDLVLDTVGGEVFRKSVKLLRPFGRIIVAGFASFALQKWNPVSWWKTYQAIPRIGISALSRGSISIGSSHLGYLLANRELILEQWNELTAFCARHDLRPMVGRVFPFDEIQEAHRWMESRSSKGKIVLQMQ